MMEGKRLFDFGQGSIQAKALLRGNRNIARHGLVWVSGIEDGLRIDGDATQSYAAELRVDERLNVKDATASRQFWINAP